LAGWVVAIIALALPVTHEILGDLPGLYFTAFGAIAAGVFIQIGVWIVGIDVARQRAGGATGETLPPPRPNLLMLTLVAHVWREAVLFNAALLLVSPRRTEAVASVLTLAVSAVALYSISSDIVSGGTVLGVSYYASRDEVAAKRRPGKTAKMAMSVPLVVLLVTSVLGLAAVYGVFFFFYFGLPLFRRTSSLYSELTVLAVSSLALLLVSGATFVVNRFVKRGVHGGRRDVWCSGCPEAVV